MSKSNFNGLIAAAFSPMDSNGSLDLSRIDDYAGILATQGCTGVFVNGSSGEGVSLSGDERWAAAQRWCEEGRRAGLRVIVHVGGTNPRDCRSLAEHAARIGADAISTVPPSYYKPASLDHLIAFLQDITFCSGDSPLYYYHIPRITGVDIVVADLLTAASRSMPNLAGAKFSHSELDDFAQCVAMDGGKYNMLFGLDEMLLPALSVGAQGAVGTTYNFAGRLYNRLMESFREGDMPRARDEQQRAIRMILILKRRGFYASAKATMDLIGLPCGTVRPPLLPLSKGDKAQLRADLEEIGFFDWR